jgi:hypothetical protein
MTVAGGVPAKVIKVLKDKEEEDGGKEDGLSC